MFEWEEVYEGPGAYRKGTKILFTDKLETKDFDEARPAETAREARNIAHRWRQQDVDVLEIGGWGGKGRRIN